MCIYTEPPRARERERVYKIPIIIKKLKKTGRGVKRAREGREVERRRIKARGLSEKKKKEKEKQQQKAG